MEPARERIVAGDVTHMRIGINYDTGIFPGNRKSRPVFSAEQVEFDMNVIARDLHCAAVRITGGSPERLAVAADFAATAGLEVWFSPFPCELDEQEMLAVFEDCAGRAEALRRRSAAPVVLVVGCEVSLFGRGFLPGADAYARIRQLSEPSPELFAAYPEMIRRFNAFLAEAAHVSSARFAGPITYAAGPWEQVDWTPFSIVSVDAYRDHANAAAFDGQLNALFAAGKPVVVTEFGCCTYRGAGERGANGWAIVEGDGENQHLKGRYVRDEIEQVTYLRELLPVFESHGIDAAFWYTFASWNRPHRANPDDDLDMASFGVVKIIEEHTPTVSGCWTPKAVFHEFAKIAAANSPKTSPSPQTGKFAPPPLK